MPYIGYWELIAKVDTFILYDDAQFMKGGWINRNRIVHRNQSQYLTLPLQKATPNKLINQISLNLPFEAQQKRIHNQVYNAYCHSEFYSDTNNLLQSAIDFGGWPSLSKFVCNSIIKSAKTLSLSQNFVLSSTLKYDRGLSAEQKVLQMCNIFECSEYYNMVGGSHLYDQKNFFKSGIKLSFLEPHHEKNLGSYSIIDIIANNGLKSIKRRLLNG
jgi:hypothetical protein